MIVIATVFYPLPEMGLLKVNPSYCVNKEDVANVRHENLIYRCFLKVEHYIPEQAHYADQSPKEDENTSNDYAERVPLVKR